MNRIKEKDWWFWFATLCMLFNYMTAWPVDLALGILPVVCITSIHLVYYFARDRHIASFPVQVRIGYILLLVLGSWPPLEFIHWIQLFGTTALLAYDYCLLARILTLMPWNRSRPFSVELAWNTFLAEPVTGSFLQTVQNKQGSYGDVKRKYITQISSNQ
jgi:hypothetical protein